MIARKTILSTTVKILNAALGYVGLFFITKYMEPGDYGIFAFALGFVTLFTVFTKLGFEKTHVKKFSEKKKQEEKLGSFIVIKTILTTLSVFLLIGSLLVWKHILGRGFETNEHELAVYIMIIFLVITSLKSIFTKTFIAKKEMAKRGIPRVLNNVIRVSFLIYVALAGYGAIALTITYIIGEIVALCLDGYFFKGNTVKKPSKKDLTEYVKFARPLVIVSISMIIMTNVDKVLIQLFWNAADVGYYFSSYRLTNFIAFAAKSLGLLLLPTYSYLHTKKDLQGIQQLTYKSERYLSMLIFPMIFGIVTLAKPATEILLNRWMPVIPILSIMAFYPLFLALEKPYQTQFIGSNKPKLARNRVLLMVIINIILNIILIPKDISSIGFNGVGLGAKGAAIATVIAYAIGLLYSRIKAYQLTGVKGNWKIVLHAISASIMAGILFAIMHYNLFIVQRWYHLIASSAFGLAIYLFILWLMREFTKEDFYFLIDMLNIKKMLIYIKDEITFNK